jgi:hypothetical protein
MGSFLSQDVCRDNEFVADRTLIDTEHCNVRVGILEQSTDSPLRRQGIRIGWNSPIFLLNNFYQSGTILRYEFDHDVVLCVFQQGSDWFVHVQTPSRKWFDVIGPFLRTQYVPFDMHPDSIELDAIASLLSHKA